MGKQFSRNLNTKNKIISNFNMYKSTKQRERYFIQELELSVVFTFHKRPKPQNIAKSLTVLCSLILKSSDSTF